jgi:hypothetical protein
MGSKIGQLEELRKGIKDFSLIVKKCNMDELFTEKQLERIYDDKGRILEIINQRIKHFIHILEVKNPKKRNKKKEPYKLVTDKKIFRKVR